jgi:hypothetical protein
MSIFSGRRFNTFKSKSSGGGTLPGSLEPSTPPPAGSNGQSYSYSLPEGPSGSSITWSLVGGSLPTGVSLVDGVISGTPSQIGTFDISLSAGQVIDLSVTINPASPTVTAPDLTGFTDGDAVNVSFTADDGIAPYSFAVTAGALPSGLSLAANGTLSGTLTAAGTFNFTVTATGNDSGTGSTSVSMVVAPLPLSISTTTLPDARIDSAYSEQLEAAGGVAPYAWSVVAGSLPTGLSLAADGTISGTPTVEETANFTVQVQDGLGTTDTQALSLAVSIGPQPVALWDFTDPTTMDINTGGDGGNPGDGDLVRYIADVVGGVPLASTSTNVTYSAAGYVENDNVSPNFAQADTTDLRSVYTTEGVIVFDVENTADVSAVGGISSLGANFRRRDQSSGDALVIRSADNGVGMVVDFRNDAGSRFERVTTATSVNISAPGRYRVATRFRDNGATKDVTVSINGDPGTPVVVSDFASPTFTGIDTEVVFNIGIPGFTRARALELYDGPVNDADLVALSTLPLTVETTSLSVATLESAYSTNLTASGGAAPYTWAVSAGSLPTGLSLASDGTISGTPTVEETANFTVEVTDDNGDTATQALSLAVQAGLSFVEVWDASDVTTGDTVWTGRNGLADITFAGGTATVSGDYGGVTSNGGSFGNMDIENPSGVFSLIHKPKAVGEGAAVLALMATDQSSTFNNLLFESQPGFGITSGGGRFFITSNSSTAVEPAFNATARNRFIGTPTVAAIVSEGVSATETRFRYYTDDTLVYEETVLNSVLSTSDNTNTIRIYSTAMEYIRVGFVDTVVTPQDILTFKAGL